MPRVGRPSRQGESERGAIIACGAGLVEKGHQACRRLVVDVVERPKHTAGPCGQQGGDQAPPGDGRAPVPTPGAAGCEDDEVGRHPLPGEVAGREPAIGHADPTERRDLARVPAVACQVHDTGRSQSLRDRSARRLGAGEHANGAGRAGDGGDLGLDAREIGLADPENDGALPRGTLAAGQGDGHRPHGHSEHVARLAQPAAAEGEHLPRQVGE